MNSSLSIQVITITIGIAKPVRVYRAILINFFILLSILVMVTKSVSLPSEIDAAGESRTHF